MTCVRDDLERGGDSGKVVFCLTDADAIEDRRIKELVCT